MSFVIQKLKVYGTSVAIIAIWWGIAFYPSSQSINITSENSTNIVTKTTYPAQISIGINRDSLKRALNGDFALMTSLISDWDIDAQLLKENGIKDIQRLPRKDFLRAQILGRAINTSRTNKFSDLQNDSLLHASSNEIDVTTNVQHKLRRFLPQTYSAASFLLALIPPSQIVALPNKFREQTELYSKAMTDPIPLDIGRHTTENLFERKPEIAFVAPYSHPSTCQALMNQGIQLYMMKDLNTLQAIAQELLNIGRLVDRPREAELMALFLSAALTALDNKLTVLNHHFASTNTPFPKVLYINCHYSYSIPTSKTLIGYFLQKIAAWDISLKYSKEHGLDDMWTTPIDKEHIVNLNPDCLIVVTEHPQAVKEQIMHDFALQQTNAVRHRQLYFVNEYIQQSPCQHIILAYNDLINAIASIE